MRALRDHQREPRAPERDVADRLFGRRLGAHVTAVTARHPSHHGQADPRTAVGSSLGSVCLKEWLEHALGRMLRNTGARVGNEQLELTICQGPSTNANGAT